MQQNKIICICLDKNTLDGSTILNYKKLDVLPINLLCKKFAILFIVKKLSTNNNIQSKRNRT